MSIGIHPCNAVPTDFDPLSLAADCQIEQVRAIGETGLDFYYEHIARDVQIKQFEGHMALARQLNLPLIIHIAVRGKKRLRCCVHEAREVGGVLHCFTETWDMAKAGLDLGFYISFSGIVTFKNALELQRLREKCHWIGY